MRNDREDMHQRRFKRHSGAPSTGLVSVFLLAFCFLISGLGVPEAPAATLLQQSDFQYAGSFLMPATLNTGDPSAGKGLAIRSVGGQLHAFSTAWNPQTFYEVNVPAPSSSNPPMATVVREWGDLTDGLRYTGMSDGVTQLMGLYWDEADQRLYWSFGSRYITGEGGDDPTLGYTTFNGTSHQSYGPFKFSSRGPKGTLACVVPIPQWFSDAYLGASGSRRLAAGCGGPQSAVTAGDCQQGPSLTSFSPSDAGTQAVRLPSTNLLGYPLFDGNGNIGPDYGPPDRGHRDTNYSITGGNSPGLGWQPRNGIGYWTDGDWLWQNVAWIDLPDKRGVVFFPTMLSGAISYANSTIHGAGAFHHWMVYDPADLAKVAQGQVAEYSVQAVNRWNVVYPGLSSTLGNWTDEPPNKVIGVAFDQTTRRLYVAVQNAGDQNHVLSSYGVTQVYVYEVQSGGTAPKPPSSLRVVPN